MTAKKFFDVIIREWGKNGKSRYLNVTKILPPDWRFVRVWRPKIENGTALLKIECLAKTTEKEVKE